MQWIENMGKNLCSMVHYLMNKCMMNALSQAEAEIQLVYKTSYTLIIKLMRTRDEKNR